MNRVVGISDLEVSWDSDDVLVTYSLGSCIGLALYDSAVGIGGLLHAMMPISAADPVRAAKAPATYADSGVTTLLQEMFDLGATRQNLVAKVAGAASQVDQGGLFRIGERNLMVLRRVLWKNDILIAAEDSGGSLSRTLMLEISSGRTLVKSNGSVREL